MKVKDEYKDIVKVESKESAYWKEIIESTEKDIENLERMLKFNKAVLDMAVKKRKEADDAFKGNKS